MLNVRQPQLLPVAIYPEGFFTFKDVDWGTVTLQGVGATLWYDKGDYLLAKFDTQALIATLGPVKDGDEFTLELQGETTSGYSFSGTDDVVILKRGK